MKEISNKNELNSLVLPYFKRGVITNNFLSLEDYEVYFNEKSLFYEATKNNLFIFRKLNDIYNVYFYINDEDEIIFPENSVVEVIEPEERICKFLEKCGFIEVKVRQEMKLSCFDKLQMDAKVYFAKAEELESVLEIIKANFDKVYGRIPSIDELRNDKILVSKDEEGQINGLVHFKTKKAFCQISHVVSLKNGIGKRVLSGYINHEKDKCNEFRVWVNSDNERAVNMYLKSGYDFSGRKSVVFSNIIR